MKNVISGRQREVGADSPEGALTSIYKSKRVFAEDTKIMKIATKYPLAELTLYVVHINQQN